MTQFYTIDVPLIVFLSIFIKYLEEINFQAQ